MLTQKRLHELLYYDEQTGFFFWLNPQEGILAGSLAGCINGKGYMVIYIEGKLRYAHRLAWLYVHGYLPEHNIDHINRIKSDNRISNLREVSKTCNARNTGNRKTNKSGVKGVCFFDECKKWRSSITINASHYHIGLFVDFTEAVCHRLAAEQCVDWSSCDSSSPAYQYVLRHIQRREKQ